MPTIGEQLARRYRIDGHLGTGGMATVHRGHDLRLGRDVAIKMLLPHLAGDPTIAERFDREARSLAALSHPNVVAVFDVEPGDPAGGYDPFFVMELCDGGSLADRIAEAGGRLTPDELVPIVAGVAEGLAAVHGAGLLHRDVKPHNVLIAAGRAKLGDLGLARPEDVVGQTSLTAAGTALGTLAYLAPERLAGIGATAAADVWSLGALVFLGLTGALPRPASTVAELADRRLDVPPLASAIAPDLGPAFDEPIAAALDPDPGRRPSPLAFSSGLVAALGRWSRDGGPGRWAGASALAGAAVSVAAGPIAAAGSPVWATGAYDSDSTASLAIPVATPGTLAGNRPARRDVGTVRRGWSLGWLAVVAALAIVLGGLAALAGVGRDGGAGLQAGPSSGSGASSSLTPASPSASVSLPPSPSSSPSPSADSFAPAKARLADLRDAVSAVSGGHGLKGRQANELEALMNQEQQALDARDAGQARSTAAQLVETIDRDSKDIGEERAQALVDAAAALRDAVAHL